MFFHLNAAKDGLLRRYAPRNDESGGSKPMTIGIRFYSPKIRCIEV
jgi:hypothetical protein